MSIIKEKILELLDSKVQKLYIWDSAANIDGDIIAADKKSLELLSDEIYNMLKKQLGYDNE